MINYFQWKHFIDNHALLSDDSKVFATTFPTQYPDLQICKFTSEPTFSHQGTAYCVVTQHFDSIELLIDELRKFKCNVCLLLLWTMFDSMTMRDKFGVRYVVIKST
jgi:hypothetical protein